MLAVEGDGGYPYAVPLSYAWDSGKLLFHCARSGHKLDAVKRNPKASFCVIGQDRVIPDEYTTGLPQCDRLRENPDPYRGSRDPKRRREAGAPLRAPSHEGAERPGDQ